MNKATVVKIVQELLADQADRSAITAGLIAEKVGLVLMMNPRWAVDLDREAVADELIRRFSVWCGEDSSLVNVVGHIAWLTPERKRDWRYWQRYREMQEARLAWDAVDGLDKSSDKILGMLEDPTRPGPWDRRGLVVGHVQSGKTGNYTGLICKAADAGYKIIIVLAGLHNNLRTQTQIRLDEGFLGFETDPGAEGKKLIGVGVIDQDASIRPNYATNRTERGDFTANNVRNLGVSPEARPWLFVVKKNKTVLTRLLRWIHTHVATVDPTTGRPIVNHLPLLVIDDEADHASVDTGEQYFDEDGKADEDHQPTAINGLIRKILHSFQRKAYVGYTATPFANIYIHERGETGEAGPDLFPAAFIHNLAAPSNYVGPARVFGLHSGERREGGLPLVREVSDHCSDDGKSGWMPVGHKSSHRPLPVDESGMPESLREAIDAFILACAARQLRGQKSQHSSMLVHVTRFNAVQLAVREKVEEYVRRIEQRLARNIGHEPVLARMHQLWESDFEPTTEAIEGAVPDAGPFRAFSWGEIAPVLSTVLSEISVRVINGTAGDVLDYEEAPNGLKVIAIGGDKLARGLTLEGLCTSYFLRASKMYDTLMQMGRWFGYRPGYLDLCRLYTTGELVEWFEHIADASEELRDEFETMVDSGGTPRDYGLKVVSHPVLMVTSRLKMRSAKSLYLSFSGHVVETVALHARPGIIAQNFEALQSLAAACGKASSIPERERPGTPDRWKGLYWDKVPYTHVTDFLSAYMTHPDAMKVNSMMLKEFITTMARDGEMTSWTVAVVGGGVTEHPVSLDGEMPVQRAKRSFKQRTADKFSIGRLLQSRDEGLDMDLPAWKAALEDTLKTRKQDMGSMQGKEAPAAPSGPSLRRIRGYGAKDIAAHPERGVLLIYLIQPEVPDEEAENFQVPIVAFGISFPGSQLGHKVEYKVNNVLWEQEYGAAE
ncbi:Z1 domain-containing protein [Duganella sp. Leaf61]|uniref:Z1 domain-containing protein n=1 Tax=Duganella sp. Leaf61 TaxID=1736227 RepID=UPI000A8193CA|nr:Z1 domain-containing protein [Duganella sp. Leaf61]